MDVFRLGPLPRVFHPRSVTRLSLGYPHSSALRSGLDTAPDLGERSRSRRPRLAVYNKNRRSRSSLAVRGVLGTAGTRKPFRVDAVVATSCQSPLIGFLHVRFDDGSPVGSGTCRGSPCPSRSTRNLLDRRTIYILFKVCC